MKFNGYSFPHPILKPDDDEVGGSASITKLIVDDSTDDNNYLLTIEYDLDNEDLRKLIDEGKAQFICEINCTGTLFRKSEVSNSLSQKIDVSKEAVRERVDLLFLIVASVKIPNYTNSEFHPDFAEFTFDIDRGDVLAYLGDSYFIAGIAYQKLKAVSSFMEIIKGKNELGDFNIILDSPKILIELSGKDYESFCNQRISKNKEYAPLLHSSIVLPTIIHSLHQLNKKDSELTEYSWAKTIGFRLENDDRLKDINFEDQNIPKIAQTLLGMPVERLLEDLTIRETSTQDED